MDDQIAQPTLSSAYARPQQQADSPAAALPFETLQHILQLAREGSSPPTAARTLKVFSRVCKLWNGVAHQEGRGELFVANSWHAERLRMALVASRTTAWQRSIRAVVIQVEGGSGSASKSQRVGDLLLALPGVERLYLELDHALAFDADSVYEAFWQPLLSALQAPTSLTHLHLELGPEAVQIDVTAMYMMLSRWPNLRSFTAPSLWSSQPQGPGGLPAAVAPDLVSALPTHLQSINMGLQLRPNIEGYFYSNANVSLLFHLVIQSRNTIQSLHFGAMHEDLLLKGDGARSLGALLEEVAPRLRLLDIRDGPRPTYITPHRPDYLVSIIEKLASTRTLTLGLDGVPSDEVFPLLGRLRTLVDLSLVSSRHSPSPIDYEYNAQAVFIFIAESKQLRSVQLPLSHCAGWSAEERKAVEDAAEATGVRLSSALGVLVPRKSPTLMKSRLLLLERDTSTLCTKR